MVPFIVAGTRREERLWRTKGLLRGNRQLQVVHSPRIPLTATLYHISLTTYFVFTVIFSWQESQIREVRLRMCGLPLLGGLGLAIGVVLDTMPI